MYFIYYKTDAKKNVLQHYLILITSAVYETILISNGCIILMAFVTSVEIVLYGHTFWLSVHFTV